MAVSSLVAASGGKTMYRTMLTSGTSYTVPAGVTYLNVLLVGGGGGAGGSRGPTAATPANGLARPASGESIYSIVNVTPGASITYAIGAGGGGGGAGADSGAAGGTTTFTGATSALGGGGGINTNDGAVGRMSLVNNEGRNSATNGSNGGGSGGSGFIVVEYWA